MGTDLTEFHKTSVSPAHANQVFAPGSLRKPLLPSLCSFSLAQASGHDFSDTCVLGSRMVLHPLIPTRTPAPAFKITGDRTGCQVGVGSTEKNNGESSSCKLQRTDPSPRGSAQSPRSPQPLQRKEKCIRNFNPSAQSGPQGDAVPDLQRGRGPHTLPVLPPVALSTPNKKLEFLAGSLNQDMRRPG